MGNYVTEELKQHPAHVTLGGVLVAQISSPAPLTKTDAVNVFVPALAPVSAGNPKPAKQSIPVVGWSPHMKFVTGAWAYDYPQIGDACIVAFDNYGILWLLSWTSNDYPWPT